VSAKSVGFHAINDRADVCHRGKIEIHAEQTLILNRDPNVFQQDPLAVNVIVGNDLYEGQLYGHVTITYTNPQQNLNWAHYISAIMDDDSNRLSGNLANIAGRIQAEGQTLEKTTHRPDGPNIAIYILFNAVEDVEFVTAVLNYLVTSRMVVERVV